MQIEEIKSGYTRISEVLEPFSKFGMIDPAVLANAANRGTRVHQYCNDYVNNIFLADIDEDCQGYVKSFMDWYDFNVVKLLYSEKRLYCDEHRITGQFDLVVKLKDSDAITLIDLKTPVNASRSWALQLSAYAYLIEDNLNFKIDRRMIIQLPKDHKKIKEIEYKDDHKDRKLFFSALDLYKHFNR